jgi:hypothetical protein
MSIRDEMVAYTGPDGLVWSSLNGPGGNGVLYTAEYAVILWRMGIVSTSDLLAWHKAMQPCLVQPGLLQRQAGNTLQEGPDDYVGYLAACAVFHMIPEARDVFNYGYKYWGSFNNTNPGKWTIDSWLWRQPQMIAHNLYGMAQTPNFIRRGFWIIAILLAAYNTSLADTDTSILSWLLIQAWSANGKPGIIGKLAVWIWSKRLLKVFGQTGMQKVFSIYFQPEHPIAKYSPII